MLQSALGLLHPEEYASFYMAFVGAIKGTLLAFLFVFKLFKTFSADLQCAMRFVSVLLLPLAHCPGWLGVQLGVSLPDTVPQQL